MGGHLNALVRYHSHEGKMTPNSLIFWRVATAKKVHFRLGHALVICHCEPYNFSDTQYHFSFPKKIQDLVLYSKKKVLEKKKVCY